MRPARSDLETRPANPFAGAVRARLLTCVQALTMVPALLLLVASGLGAQEVERYALSDDDVAIYNLVGQVSIEPGSGGSVVVELVRGGNDAHELRVETGRIDGRQTLRVIYPSDRVVYRELRRGSSTNLRVRDDGTFFGGGGLLSRGGRVTISGSGRGLEAHADLRVLVPEGQTIAVYLGAGRTAVRNVDGRVVIDTGSGSIDVLGMRGSLALDTGSGHVSVRDVEGDVDIDTGSGRVEVHGVRGYRLAIDTGSGRVAGDDVFVEELNVDTGSGSINLDQVATQRASLETGSGSVQLGLVSDVRDLEIDTGSGRVSLSVPASLNAQLELDTGSGGINVDLPLRVIRSERNHLLARAGEGGGTIRIDTGSGGIRVRGS